VLKKYQSHFDKQEDIFSLGRKHVSPVALKTAWYILPDTIESLEQPVKLYGVIGRNIQENF